MDNQDLNKALGLKDQRDKVYIEPSSKSATSDKCTLATTLRIIGVINVLGSIILGFNLCGQGGMLASRYDENPVGLICFVISGIVGCIICFALAKCVQAATKYLNSKQ